MEMLYILIRVVTTWVCKKLSRWTLKINTHMHFTICMFYLNKKIFLILWRTKDSQLLRPHTTSSEGRSEDCINRACIWFQGATGNHVSLALSFLLPCLWVFPPIWMTLHLFSNWSNISHPTRPYQSPPSPISPPDFPTNAILSVLSAPICPSLLVLGHVTSSVRLNGEGFVFIDTGGTHSSQYVIDTQ